MITSISWKNIWRNKLRSGVILASISIGIFGGVFSWAFTKGMTDQRVKTAIENECSHIQLHHPDYMIEPDQKIFMQNADSIKTQLLATPNIEAVTSRTIYQAMVTSAKTGTGIKLIGINADDESKITAIHNRLIDGKYLEGMKRNPILIGEKLADKLGVKLRSKVVVTLQDANGEITRTQFRVAGIYKTTNSMYDAMNVFIRNTDFEKLTGFSSQNSHEIAVLLKDGDLMDETLSQIQSQYPNLDVQTWKTLMPEVSLASDSLDVFMLFFMIIIMIGLGFAIVNTMLMAILERIKELGMLMAIGMSRFRVFRMILTETALLSLTGAFVGLVIGIGFSLLLGKTGMHLTNLSDGMESMGLDTVIYPVFALRMAVFMVGIVLLTSIIASIFPAIKALKLNPAEALRTE